ncbi:MAG: DUF4118 domain-containing protein, partial [Candidatus Obscuribacterales bacterium]|nr:DUF4118 domain-containing protein [Candidatus Obscuribacterales bacterium]
AKRMATALKAEWSVAYVETPAQSSMRDEDRNRILETLRLAAELGGQVIELQGHSVPEELIKCALQYNASKIVIGKPARTRLQELINGSVVDEVIRNSGAIDVYVITGEGGTHQARQSARAKKKTPMRQYISAIIIVVLTTLVARCMLPYFELANIVMIYLLGVLVISVRYGRGPSILSSITSVAAFDFFCVPPYLTFAVSDTQYIFTFMVMLTVALVISTLTVRVKQQAEAARTREQRTAFLYRMSRELASTEDIIDLYKIGLRHISEVFDAEASIIIPNENERPSSVMLAPGHYALNSVDLAVAHWVMHNRQVAGAGSQTLPGTPALYLPLVGTNRSLAVLAIKPFEQLKFSSPEQLQLLHTFVNQLSQACERSLLSVENEKAQLQMKTEQLRSSLLSSVSHDLRTPLATITGAASSIIEAPSASLDPEACRERATQIFEESVRLNRLVTNLLDMTRLQSGTLQVRKEWHPVDDLVGAALSYMDDKMGGRTVKTNIPSDLPLVPVDDILIQQVFVNLLENAIKYTPDKATIELTARLEDEHMIFDVADNGPGIPAALRSQVFEKFYRQEAQTASGAGLGLAICKGIIEAHSGKIWVEENSGGGALFRFTIPIDSQVPSMPPELPEEAAV